MAEAVFRRVMRFIGDKYMFAKSFVLKVMDVLSVIPDEPYLKMLYRIRTGKKLNLNPPVTLNEKLQYLKIHGYKPEYSKMADKAEAKKYVASRIGEQYIIPQLGLWDRAEDIDFDSLPDQFVLKCTHDSGSVIICRDKSSFDRKEAVRKLSAAVKRNFYNSKREWGYKGLKGRILAEKYMEDELVEGKIAGTDLSDYKFFCFNGVPRIAFTVKGGHQSEEKIIRRMYDTDWNLIPVGIRGKKPVTQAEERPAQLEEMLSLAAKLSEGIPFLRVDFYIINGKVYFGELTFFHMSGCETFDPPEYDRIFGEYLKL